MPDPKTLSRAQVVAGTRYGLRRPIGWLRHPVTICEEDGLRKHDAANLVAAKWVAWLACPVVLNPLAHLLKGRRPVPLPKGVPGKARGGLLVASEDTESADGVVGALQLEE